MHSLSCLYGRLLVWASACMGVDVDVEWMQFTAVKLCVDVGVVGWVALL